MVFEASVCLFSSFKELYLVGTGSCSRPLRGKRGCTGRSSQIKWNSQLIRFPSFELSVILAAQTTRSSSVASVGWGTFSFVYSVTHFSTPQTVLEPWLLGRLTEMLGMKEDACSQPSVSHLGFSLLLFLFPLHSV